MKIFATFLPIEKYCGIMVREGSRTYRCPTQRRFLYRLGIAIG